MSTSTDTASRPRLAFLLLWGVPSLLAADTLVAVLVGWRPGGTIEHGLLAALLCWLASSCLWLAPSLRARLGGLWRELTLLIPLLAIGWRWWPRNGVGWCFG